MSQLFALGGQSIGVSASTSVLPIEHPGLISFRMDWLDLLAVQGTLQESSSAPHFKSIMWFLLPALRGQEALGMTQKAALKKKKKSRLSQ